MGETGKKEIKRDLISLPDKYVLYIYAYVHYLMYIEREVDVNKKGLPGKNGFPQTALVQRELAESNRAANTRTENK